jgi:hypothetical protein
MKIYGVRLGACIFWNIFGPKYNRILGVFFSSPLLIHIAALQDRKKLGAK